MGLPGQPRREVRAAEFPGKGHQENQTAHGPHHDTVEAADIGAKSGVGEEDRQHNGADKACDTRTPFVNETLFVMQRNPK